MYRGYDEHMALIFPMESFSNGSCAETSSFNSILIPKKIKNATHVNYYFSVAVSIKIIPLII